MAGDPSTGRCPARDGLTGSGAPLNRAIAIRAAHFPFPGRRRGTSHGLGLPYFIGANRSRVDTPTLPENKR